MKKILLSLFLLILGGCSSSDTVVVTLPDPDEETLDEIFGTSDSESQDNNDQLPLDGFGSIDTPENGFDSIPGRELVGDLTYDPFVETAGISIHITSFGFNSSGEIRITALMNNQGSAAVEFATCNVVALQNSFLVSDGILSFAGLGFIDPDKSGVGIINFFDDLPDGFNSFDELQIDCTWNEDQNTRIDFQSSTEKVEFLGYSISDRGYANVSLRRTNTSDNEAPILRCTVEARIGNVILDVANVGFPTVAADGVFETNGLFLSFSSLQGFNNDDFDTSIWYCEY